MRLASFESKGIVDVIEHFVNPSLRSNPDLLYRARALIALLLVFDILLGFASIVTTIKLVNSPQRLFQLAGLLLCSLLIAGISDVLVRLRRHGSYSACSVAAILVATVAVVSGIGMSGGVRYSSSTQLLVVPPLMAYFFGSMRWGNYTVLLSFLVVSIFVLAEAAGFQFPRNTVSVRDAKIDQLLVCFIGICTVSAMAFVYELTAIKLKQERDREHQKAVALSQTDALTGLANRRNFDTSLEQRIAAYGAMSPPRHFVLGCIDLDGFKPINDQYGHAIGDEVLRIIAERLLLSCRGDDIVGRHGGDEFLIMFETKSNVANADTAGVELMAQRLLKSLCEPIDTTVGQLNVGASLGFAIFPDDANAPVTLRKAADGAMYDVKSAGGNSWRLFSPSTDCPRGSEDVESAKQSTSADNEKTGLEPNGDAVSDLKESATDSVERMSFYSRLVNFFIHPSLFDESDKLHRARFLVMALLLVCGVVVATAVPLALGPFPFGSKVITLAICIPVLFIAAFLLFTLRHRGNQIVCGAALVILAYTSILIGVCVSGGAAISVSAPQLVFPPLIAYFFGGMRWGTYAVVASLVAIVAFAGLEFTGFEFYNVIDPKLEVYNRLLNCLVCLFSVSGMAFIYEFTAFALKRERDGEKEKVDRLAHTDALTGLANRSSFDAELSARIARYNKTVPRSCFTLCYVDLDGFKPINDRYGHNVGDEVLQAISERLRLCLRDSDYLGRHGGDEFMLIFDAVKDIPQLEIIAKRVSQAIAQPISTQAGRVSVVGSLGFASFPDHGDDADSLKRAADKAMYAAKRERSGCGYYQPEIHRLVVSHI